VTGTSSPPAGDEVVECVPNVSEGRRTDVLEKIVEAVRAVEGVRMLDLHRDGDHNRAVLTYVVPVAQALQAGFAVAKAAVEEIDLRDHEGAHPRLGALDVFPFVPLGATPMARCVDLAHALGARIAAELDVPVYYYAEAALRDDRRRLEKVRGKGFEHLRAAVADDPLLRPDAGPARLHPSAGAAIVGARPFLIAYNVYLSTDDVDVARRIARHVRASSGGLRGVKALGLALSGRPSEKGKITGRQRVQVSMNITDVHGGALVAALDLIRAEAARQGVGVVRSELVGLLPLEAVLGAAAAFLQLDGLTPDRIVDLHASATAPRSPG